ncbi:MAG: hypothetical protein FWD08_00190 [Alphaproteobacteria bacterium]|nr:hypothetical protein [Alphaproteobacteria bacterium]
MTDADTRIAILRDLQTKACHDVLDAIGRIAILVDDDIDQLIIVQRATHALLLLSASLIEIIAGNRDQTRPPRQSSVERAREMLKLAQAGCEDEFLALLERAVEEVAGKK